MCCPQFRINLEVEFDNDPGKFGGSATNRKCTDIFGLIIVILLFWTVISLTYYCHINGDIDKILNGYDDNGNICGKNNINRGWKQLEGFGKNMERKQFVYIKEDATLGQTKECVEYCTIGNYILGHYCVSDEKFIPVSILVKFWLQIISSWFLCLFLSSIVVLCIVFYAWSFPFVFRRVIMGLSFVLTVILWGFTIYFYTSSNQYFKTFLISAIIVTIITILIWSWLFMIQTLMKKYFAAQIIKEISLTIFAMPLLVLQSILLSIILFIVLVFVYYTWFSMQTFSYADQINVGNETIINYVPHPIATVSGALMIYGFIVFYEILKNCQCFIVSGCVAQWYFTRRSGGLSQPIKRTIENLIKYHLGSICWASFILPKIYVLRAIINGIKGAASGNNKESIYTCSCRLLSETCLAVYVTCLNFFSRNGLIMTAIYGYTFCEGTSRAHKLINHNIFNVASIKNDVDFLILMIEIHIVTIIGASSAISSCFNIPRHYQLYVVINSLILIVIYADFFISVLDVIIETYFLCFCEDVQYKSGAPKPYYMSTNFAQFVENANKFQDPLKWKNIADEWDKGPKRIYSRENFFETFLTNSPNAYSFLRDQFVIVAS